MKTAIQVQAQTPTRKELAELAELARQHRELMAPHIDAVAAILGMSNSPSLLMAGGKIAERIYTAEEEALFATLNDLSDLYAKRLGLATPSQAG